VEARATNAEIEAPRQKSLIPKTETLRQKTLDAKNDALMREPLKPKLKR
jgi:hypothetical protein